MYLKSEPYPRVKQTHLLVKYDKNATFAQKLIFAISSANRFLHNREIADIMFNYDQSVEVDTLVERLSARASRHKKDGLIVNYLVGGNVRNTVYGLPDWLDENREIKEGYEYKSTYFVGQKMVI